jgi:GNAT superfamily N-acetyltransferase
MSRRVQLIKPSMALNGLTPIRITTFSISNFFLESHMTLKRMLLLAGLVGLSCAINSKVPVVISLQLVRISLIDLIGPRLMLSPAPHLSTEFRLVEQYGNQRMRLHFIHVLPSSQGKGVGAQLLEFCFDYSERMRLLFFVIANEKIASFFEYHGMSLAGEPVVSEGGAMEFFLKYDLSADKPDLSEYDDCKLRRPFRFLF